MGQQRGQGQLGKKIFFALTVSPKNKLTSFCRRRHFPDQWGQQSEQQRRSKRDAREDSECARQDLGSSLLKQLSRSTSDVASNRDRQKPNTHHQSHHTHRR